MTLNSPDTEYGRNIWSFTQGDVTNFDAVLQNLETAGYPNESESFHYSFAFKDISGFAPLVLQNPDTGYRTLILSINQNSMGNPSADETFVFDVPIRYICENENPHTPITSLKALNQGGVLNGTTQSSLRISAGDNVYIGSTDQLIGAETIVPLNGQAIWLPLPPTEGPTGDEEADDTGGGGGSGVITDFDEDTQTGGGTAGGGGGDVIIDFDGGVVIGDGTGTGGGITSDDGK